MLKTEMIDKLNAQMNLELFLPCFISRWAPGAAITALKERPPSCVVMPRKRWRTCSVCLITWRTPAACRVLITWHPLCRIRLSWWTVPRHLWARTADHQKINELAHAAMTSQDYQPLISFSGMWLNSTKKRSCLNPCWINYLWQVNPGKVCTSLIKSCRRSTRRINRKAVLSFQHRFI